MEVNALIAIKTSTVSAIKSLVASAKGKIEAQAELTAQEQKAMALLRVSKEAEFIKATVGSDQWVLMDIVTTPERVEKLAEVIPSAVVAGCWNIDGSQYGQTLKRTQVGTDEFALVPDGVPVYPIHPKLLDFMPDDVVYDEKGLEVSRTRPTKLKQVHKYLGWADRRWT